MRVRKEEVPVLEALGVYFKYGYGVDIIDWYAYQCLPYLSVMISTSKIHFCTLIMCYLTQIDSNLRLVLPKLTFTII